MLAPPIALGDIRRLSDLNRHSYSVRADGDNPRVRPLASGHNNRVYPNEFAGWGRPFICQRWGVVRGGGVVDSFLLRRTVCSDAVSENDERAH